MKSIMHEKDGTCYLCQMLHKYYVPYAYTEEHHVFGGKANRPLSEKYGLKVHLCVWHHRIGPEAVHINADVARKLKREAQEVFERTHTREEFRAIFSKSWLYDDPEEEIEALYEECHQGEMEEAENAAGFQLLPDEEALIGMGSQYLMIEKIAAARELNNEQFKNLIQIVGTLEGQEKPC